MAVAPTGLGLVVGRLSAGVYTACLMAVAPTGLGSVLKKLLINIPSKSLIGEKKIPYLCNTRFFKEDEKGTPWKSGTIPVAVSFKRRRTTPATVENPN